MSAHTPIDPEDIRKGDQIRWEIAPDCPQPLAYSAVELRADRDRMSVSNIGQHYLVERTEPEMVHVPSTPTFGRLSWRNGAGESHTVVANWHSVGDHSVRSDLGHMLTAHSVTKFERGTFYTHAAFSKLDSEYKKAVADRDRAIVRSEMVEATPGVAEILNRPRCDHDFRKVDYGGKCIKCGAVV